MTRFLLTLQAVVSLATAITLTLAPSLIPASVGVVVEPRAFLLCYLIAASELTLAFASVVALWAKSDLTTEAFIAITLFFHVSSGLAGVYGITTGLPKAIWMNAVPHFLIALAFAVSLYRSVTRRSLQAMGCQ